MMARHHQDALWAKLQELELQLAAYKLLRGEDASEGRALWAPEATCRGRQYDAYMRRRDAKREAKTRVAGGGNKPMSPGALRCVVRDAQEVKKKTPPSVSSSIPRSRTVTGSPARHHQRRSSVADLGDAAATPRPFLRRGTGTGGAARPSSVDVPSTPTRLERGHAHSRSVSELPFDTARKRWGSPERPAAMFAADDSHRDLSTKGLKKLLSFVRKGGGSKDTGKPVSGKGWSGAPACSLLDAPFDWDGHRFPMTRTVGISGS